MSPKLSYLKGDATEPIQENVLICHIVNNLGMWGSGFVLALSKKWKEPEREYRGWNKGTSHKQIPFELGNVIFVPVNFDKQYYVANMIGQEGVIGMSLDGTPPIRYEALEKCLKDCYSYCESKNLTLHGPMFGSGLAGGDWKEIEKIILKVMTVDTFIYKF
jgi:O-acetyl-ADP-ribose deacetylase (regulator of RNase III)